MVPSGPEARTVRHPALAQQDGNVGIGRDLRKQQLHCRRQACWAARGCQEKEVAREGSWVE